MQKLISLGIYTHLVFFVLLRWRKRPFEAPLLGLFALGIAIFAIGILKPPSIKAWGAEFSNLVYEDKSDKVASSVKAVFESAPEGKPDLKLLADAIKEAQKPSKLETAISKATGNTAVVLPEQKVEELAKNLAKLKGEEARREAIMRSYLGIGEPEKDEKGNPKYKDILDVFRQ